MTSLPKTVTISSHAIFQRLEEESVLLNLLTERYFDLDDVGTRMWELLSKNSDTNQTVTELLSEYEVSETQLRHDLAKLVSELAENGLLTIDGA